MKKGDVEVEVSGSEKEVSDTFERIDKLADKFLAAFSTVKESKRDLSLSEGGETPELQPSVDTEVPVITKARSASEAVQHLLASSWGQRPRALSEITSALQSNAMPFPSTTLSGVLFNLVKKGKVRRFKTAGGYLYRGTPGPEGQDREIE